jgi:hypothetical protein
MLALKGELGEGCEHFAWPGGHPPDPPRSPEAGFFEAHAGQDGLDGPDGLFLGWLHGGFWQLFAWPGGHPPDPPGTPEWRLPECKFAHDYAFAWPGGHPPDPPRSPESRGCFGRFVLKADFHAKSAQVALICPHFGHSSGAMGSKFGDFGPQKSQNRSQMVPKGCTNGPGRSPAILKTSDF